MSNFSDLIEYFETLATEHVSIKHTDQEKHFFRFEIDEVLGGLNRSDVNFPMLILEGYSFDFTDNRSDNVIKNRQGAFVLLGKVEDASDYNTLHDTWDALEVIGDDILARIRYDKQQRNVAVVRDFKIENVMANLILNEIGNHAGIRYTFTISSPFITEYDEDVWAE